MISSKVLSALFLTLLPVVSALENAPGVPADSILYYSPSVVGAVVFGVVYILASIFLFINTWAWKDWYALALPVGAFFQGVGFFVRIPYKDQPGGIGLYIIQDLFIVLAPACYFAFNYATFGRFAQTLTKEHQTESKSINLTLIPARKMALFFVTSDVVTFLIQAGGGSMQTSEDLASVGEKIFLIGIILQFVSYLIFLFLAIRCHLIVKSKFNASRPRMSNSGVVYPSVTKYYLALYFSSVFIIIRSIYRTIELAMGFRGYLVRNEVFLFVLDSLPLVFAIAIYIPFWPSSLYPISQKFAAGEKGSFVPMWDLNKQRTPLLDRASSSKESLA